MRSSPPLLIGQVFNRFTIISGGPRVYFCKCVCGNTKEITKGNLIHGGTKSCGCLKKELAVPFGFHALYPELYIKFKGAKARCNNPKSASFKYYGGRGIKFLFTEGYVDFAKYALEMGWKPGLEIDRIDNDGNYVKGNVRFVTRSENQRNKHRK